MPEHRAALFVGLCLAAASLVVGYALASKQSRAVASTEIAGMAEIDDARQLASVAERPHILFISKQPGPGFGRVAIVPLDAPGGPRYLTSLSCDRVYFAAGTGVCLAVGRDLVGRYTARLFDSRFTVRATLPLQGYPSRVRISPDGRVAAATVFVAGDSYAVEGFSTRTTLVDTASGASLADLETFAAFRDGRPFREQDINYWGVTFKHDSDGFYATLASGGETYLVEGTIRGREVRVLRSGVECPSLSPDERRLAFKSRRAGTGRPTWELRTLGFHPPGERVAEVRNTDDQAEWLDSDSVLYSLPDENASLAATGVTNIWRSFANGTDAPRRLVPYAYSPAVVRRPGQ